MKKNIFAITVIFLLGSMTLHANEVVYMKWDKGKANRTAAAFDLTARKVIWEFRDCKTPSFAQKTSIGILIGCDDSAVVMLDAATGKELWRRDISVQQPSADNTERRSQLRANRFHSETPEGFFISMYDEAYVLLGKRGEYLMLCDKSGCNTSQSANK